MMPTLAAQKKLLTLWCLCAAIILVIMVVKSLGGIYGSQLSDAWAWFIPNILPTLSLMITVAIVDFGTLPNEKQSHVYLFQLAFWLSFAYLVLIGFTILNPIPSDESPIDVMKRSNLWLGPIQGLVSAILGAFFIKSK